MARLHSGKHGKSGRKRPKAELSQVKPAISEKEIKEIIIKMAKEGTMPSKIGVTLRDKYAVGSIRSVLGVPLLRFLKESDISSEYPEDMFTLIKRALNLRKHLNSFKKDVHNSVKLSHIESKIQRLAKYYISRKRLPGDWKYDPQKVALVVK